MQIFHRTPVGSVSDQPCFVRLRWSLFLSPLCDEIICGRVSCQPWDCDDPVVAQSIIQWNSLLSRIPSAVRWRWSRRCTVHRSMKLSIARIPSAVRLRWSRRCPVHRAMKPSITPYPVIRAIAMISSLPNPSCDENLYCHVSRQPCDCDNPVVVQSIWWWNPLLPHTQSAVRLR